MRRLYVLTVPLLVVTAGCSHKQRKDAADGSGDHGADEKSRPLSQLVEIVSEQTIEDIGAGQGIAVLGDKIYVYGDADTGIIREMRLDADGPRLVSTGRAIELTREGEDLIPHPTGLSFHPEYGTVLGNTVNGQGTIYFLDFDQALADGNLDRAVLHRVTDDAAVNGTRPEFVRWEGRWYIATADYGERDTALRLYDPVRLRQVQRSSEPGVMTARLPCGAYVQSLHWIHDEDVLVFARNEEHARGYVVTWLADPRQSLDDALSFVRAGERRELEGFALLDEGWVLLLNAQPTGNLEIGRRRTASGLSP